jgi:hypothetical protein
VTLSEFEATLAAPTPPAGLTPLLAALWHDARGDWGEAHRIAQDIEGDRAAWVHAYLHRKEGDLDNAAYWYALARRAVAKDALGAEWKRVVAALLAEE